MKRVHSEFIQPEEKALAILRGVATEAGWTCAECGFSFKWNKEPLEHKSFRELYDEGYIIAP